MVKKRSPQYPYIDLSDAIKRIEKVYDAEGRSSMPRDVLAEHCGYPKYTGSASKVLAALKKYGLVEKINSGFRLSEDAIAIVALKHSDPDGVRAKALYRAAHAVDLFSTLKDEFGLSASESNLIAQLQIKGFTKDGAAKAAKAYLSTMELVSRDSEGYDIASDNYLMSENENEASSNGDEPNIEVGDLIQGTVGGQDVFPQGARVLGLSEDKNWIFHDFSASPLEVKDATIMQKAEKTSVAPPTMPAHFMTALHSAPAADLITEGSAILSSGKVKDVSFEVRVTGEINQTVIDRIIKYLELAKDDYEM